MPISDNILPGYSTSLGPPSWVSGPVEIDSIEAEAEELMLANMTAVLASLMDDQTAEIAANQQSPQVITWDRLTNACENCPEYTKLHSKVQKGLPDTKSEWDADLLPYFKLRKELTTMGPVVLVNKRPVIPISLRNETLQHLHGCHNGATRMFERALSDLYWPNYKQDIVSFSANCSVCRQIAPSNPDNVSNELADLPAYPFQIICADFFSHNGRNYLAIADKYSNWLSVLKLTKDDSSHVIKALREYFTIFGVCETLATDGAAVFTSDTMKKFCDTWGVRQRISSAYYARSNKRAEVGVKSAKRLIQENTNNGGDLCNDSFARALLSHRNTPDPDTKVSPAEIIYGRRLRDHIPRYSYTPQEAWATYAQKREESFLQRHFAKRESLNEHAKQLKPLLVGQTVYIQDQAGNNPKRWNKSGTIVEALPFDSYIVRVDGSRKVTKRNRKFLRAYTPFKKVESPAERSAADSLHPSVSLLLSNVSQEFHIHMNR